MSTSESSLLDRIHAAATLAEERGQRALAQWLRKHADEPCPAAIAEAMEIGEPRKCIATVNVFGYSFNTLGCPGEGWHCEPVSNRCDVTVDAKQKCWHHVASASTRPLCAHIYKDGHACARESVDEHHILHKFVPTPQPSVILPSTHIADPDGAFPNGKVTCWALHHDFVSIAMDGSTDSCGLVLLPGHQCRQPKAAYIHQKCRTDAPPPEPANAQGSEANDEALLQEACANCGDDELHNLTSDRIKYDENGDALCPKCGHDRTAWSQTIYDNTNPPKPAPQPFSPPFTAEEARDVANTPYRDARKAATLRSYADLLDRDDALERAAKSMLNSWDIGERGTALNMRIRDLRSVLQRAKERA